MTAQKKMILPDYFYHRTLPSGVPGVGDVSVGRDLRAIRRNLRRLDCGSTMRPAAMSFLAVKAAQFELLAKKGCNIGPEDMALYGRAAKYIHRAMVRSEQGITAPAP